MPMWMKPGPRFLLKQRVREAVTQIAHQGLVPSERLLRERVPGHGGRLLLTLRDELLEEGEVPAWRDGRNHPRRPAERDYGDEAERADVEATRLLVLQARRAGGRP